MFWIFCFGLLRHPPAARPWKEVGVLGAPGRGFPFYRHPAWITPWTTVPSNPLRSVFDLTLLDRDTVLPSTDMGVWPTIGVVQLTRPGNWTYRPRSPGPCSGAREDASFPKDSLDMISIRMISRGALRSGQWYTPGSAPPRVRPDGCDACCSVRDYHSVFQCQKWTWKGQQSFAWTCRATLDHLVSLTVCTHENHSPSPLQLDRPPRLCLWHPGRQPLPPSPHAGV